MRTPTDSHDTSPAGGGGSASRGDTHPGGSAGVPGAGSPPAGAVPGRSRLALFSSVRYLTPAVVLLAIAARPDLAVDLGAVAGLLTIQVAYGAATHTFILRRPEAIRPLLWGGIVLDLAVAAALVAATGGPGGPLTVLFALQALAGGILLSAAVGFRILLLGSIAILALDITTAPSGTGILPHGIEAIAVLWLIGGSATVFSVFNERALRRRTTELALVRQIVLDIQDTLSLDTALEHLVRGVTERFNFEGAAALLRTGETLTCVATSGITGPTGHGVPIRGSLERALATRQPIVVPGEEARRGGETADLLGSRGFVAVPLDGAGLLIATRRGRRGRGAKVRGNEIASLELLARHATLAVANARMHAHVSTLAVTDALTGLANHGEFQRRLRTELGRLNRYAALQAPGHALSLLLIDIDHFKRFNDRFGHQAGDEVLRSVAEALRQSVRSFDIAARYGGEEFAVILPETLTEGAMRVAERIQETLADSPFPVPNGRKRPVPVTVSIGVATAAAHGRDPDALVGAADTALYRSKERGRNRITVARAGDGTLGSVVNLRASATRRRSGPAARPARGGSRSARAASSPPRRRTPRG